MNGCCCYFYDVTCDVSRLIPNSILHLHSSLLFHNHTYLGVELTWNYGSEAEEGMVYNTGNADTTGTSDGSKIRGGAFIFVMFYVLNTIY